MVIVSKNQHITHKIENIKPDFTTLSMTTVSGITQ